MVRGVQVELLPGKTRARLHHRDTASIPEGDMLAGTSGESLDDYGDESDDEE
jgi:hypothetical protein